MTNRGLPARLWLEPGSSWSPHWTIDSCYGLHEVFPSALGMSPWTAIPRPSMQCVLVGDISYRRPYLPTPPKLAYLKVTRRVPETVENIDLLEMFLEGSLVRGLSGGGVYQDPRTSGFTPNPYEDYRDDVLRSFQDSRRGPSKQS